MTGGGTGLCFVIQVLLFAGASAAAWLVCGVLGAPLWAGGAAGMAFLAFAWVGYLVYQARHPNWWPPWDEGLPQQMRMLNAFVPAAGVFLALLFLLPVFQQARHKALQRRERLEQEQRQRQSQRPHAIEPASVDGRKRE